MESINALLIQQGLAQGERLTQLNKVAIAQMKSLLANSTLKIEVINTGLFLLPPSYLQEISIFL